MFLLVFVQIDNLNIKKKNVGISDVQTCPLIFVPKIEPFSIPKVSLKIVEAREQILWLEALKARNALIIFSNFK